MKRQSSLDATAWQRAPVLLAHLHTCPVCEATYECFCGDAVALVKVHGWHAAARPGSAGTTNAGAEASPYARADRM